MRIHHVNIVVRPGEAERLLGFYTDVLGFARIAKPAEGTTSGGAWFAIDDQHQLHVSERVDAVMHDDMHFAIVVDDFDATIARLAAAGVQWQPQPDLFGGRRGSTRDPLGHRIELLEPAGRLA
jgi:catechol 2,3-dioxygenase-like lactoylglutathione lyase family enzyme